MIDRTKFRTLSRLPLLLFLLFITLFFIQRSFARFQTNASGKISNRIAFYVVEAQTQSQEIKIGNLAPDGQEFSYAIDVSNFNSEKVSEVDLEYSLQIITTTNIPVDYKLYKGDSTTNIIGTKEVITDDDGMYFLRFTPQVGNFTHEVSKTETFRLIITFPNIYNDSFYQDLVESIEVTVDAHQV